MPLQSRVSKSSLRTCFDILESTNSFRCVAFRDVSIGEEGGRGSTRVFREGKKGKWRRMNGGIARVNGFINRINFHC